MMNIQLSKFVKYSSEHKLTVIEAFRIYWDNKIVMIHLFWLQYSYLILDLYFSLILYDFQNNLLNV